MSKLKCMVMLLVPGDRHALMGGTCRWPATVNIFQDLLGSVYHTPVIGSLLCGQVKMSLRVFKHLMVRMNVSHP